MHMPLLAEQLDSEDLIEDHTKFPCHQCAIQEHEAIPGRRKRLMSVWIRADCTHCLGTGAEPRIIENWAKVKSGTRLRCRNPKSGWIQGTKAIFVSYDPDWHKPVLLEVYLDQVKWILDRNTNPPEYWELA